MNCCNAAQSCIGRTLLVLLIVGSVLVSSLSSWTGGSEAVRLGEGEVSFDWVPGWGQLPEGMTYGNTHGCIAVDSQDRIYVNTDTDHAIIVFEADGTFVRSFGAEFKGGLHGMTLVEESGKEFLYLAHIGLHQIAKVTLEGEVLWRLGYPKESGLYEKAGSYRPTAVAVAANGDLYAADGYGLSWVHQYDRDQNYVRSFGGPGSKPGQMKTPHGLWIDTRSHAPILMVADRENHRLQAFSLDGNSLGIVSEELRRPCNLSQHGSMLAVADLTGRITILGKDNELLAHLGEQPDPEKRARNNVASDLWRDGEFVSPHGIHWDSQGNLYVMDWVSEGRISKLQRVR
jgi:hypothetical protein